MASDLAGVRALAFDVGGTVFDWHRTVRTEIARLAAERGASMDAAAFAGEWRSGFFARLFREAARLAEDPIIKNAYLGGTI